MSIQDYLCNLVIPGFPKSGTTSLHALLEAHPQINMSRIKEPHHFAKDANFDAGSMAHNALFTPTNDAIWYGEASTIYCISDAARRRIRASLPAPKLIFLLREPIVRLLSHYRWMTRLGFENRRLGEAVKIDGLGFDPNRDFGGNYRSYLQFSQYATYVPQWRDDFGAENLLILRSEALKTDPMGQLKRCTEFLGLTNLLAVSNAELNVTDSVARQNNPPWMSIAGRLVPARLKENRAYAHLRFWAKQLTPPTEPPVVTDAELDRLRTLLADDIAYYDAIDAT